MTDRRLIEDSLPLAEISEYSAKEKSVRHGHISTLHIWWARRPLAAARAAIFSAATPAPEEEARRNALHSLLADGVKWSNSTDPQLVAQLRQEIPTRADGRPLRLLDPFGGGGAIPLEGLRLGLDVVSNDLNPIAHLIQRCTLLYPQRYRAMTAPEFSAVSAPIGGFAPGEALVADLEHWCGLISKRVQARMRACYSADMRGKRAGAYLWVRTMTCQNPACRGEIPIFKQLWLSQKDRLALRLELDPSRKDFSFEVVTLQEGEKPGGGTVSRDKVECPHCNQITGGSDLRSLADTSGFGQRLACLVYSESGRNKEYRVPGDDDHERFQLAQSELRRSESDRPSYIPEQELPYLRSIFNVHVYGIRRWRDLFNDRQLLLLSSIASEIHSAAQEIRENGSDSEYAEAIAAYLTLMLGRAADYNSSICRWVAKGEFVANTFARQALGMVWDYAEVDPFAGAAGSWDGAFDWIRRVVMHASTIEKPATVQRGSATRMRSEKPFDLVITDPPYYDAVPYADLSDFFYVWARLCLQDVLPNDFATELSPKRDEAVQLAERNQKYAYKTKERFEELLTASFARCHSMLEDSGLMGVMFAHKSTAAWETAISSLLSAGFVVTASWPLDTERGQRLRSQGSAALASSVLIVCRKRAGDTDGFIDDVEPALEARLHERLDYFWSQGIRGADFFMSAIGPAVEVFGQYRRVLKLSGEQVGVADLLDRVRSVVADYALQKIVHGERAGDVDEESRFYVIWRWAFGTADVEAGEAIHMAQSMGCEFDSLASERGVLDRRGDKVRLRGPELRNKVRGLGERSQTGAYAPLIDVLHRASHLWANGERQRLADFLVESLPPGGSERMQRLAQSIVDVLVPGDKERTLYENFLVGSRSLPAPSEKDSSTANQQKLF